MTSTTNTTSATTTTTTSTTSTTFTTNKTTTIKIETEEVNYVENKIWSTRNSANQHTGTVKQVETENGPAVEFKGFLQNNRRYAIMSTTPQNIDQYDGVKITVG